MSEDTTRYTRLPRVRNPFLGQRLWQGPDHLLSLSFSSFGERNKRFYFRDIQAITIESTDTGKYFNVTFGLIIALFGVLLFFPGLVTDGDAALGFGILMGIVLVPSTILLIVNLVLGGTCTCRIHTAVQTESMRGLSRTRTAMKFANKVIPLIEQSQGAITPESLGANAEELHRYKASRHAETSKHQTPKAEIHHEKGVFHLITFLLLLYFALGSFYDAVESSDIKNTFDAILFFVWFIFNVTAIVKQSNSDMPSSLRFVTWSAIIFNSLYTFMILTFIMFWAIVSMENAASITPEQMREYPLYTTTMLFGGVIHLVLSGLGLVILARFNAAYRDALTLAQSQADVQADVQADLKAFDDAPKGP